MKPLQLVTLWLASSLTMWGCSPKVIMAGRDSVKLETRVEYIERIDTAFIELPRQAESIVTRDTFSHLENDFAFSDASYSGGFLQHNLETKDAKVPIEYLYIETVRDSIVYRNVERVIAVKQPLSQFIRFQVIGFWVLLVGLIIFIYIKIRF